MNPFGLLKKRLNKDFLQDSLTEAESKKLVTGVDVAQP
jgi:hypothetical protein